MNSANPGMKIRHTGAARNMVKPGLGKTVVQMPTMRFSVNRFYWIYRERFHPFEQTLRFLTEYLLFRKAVASRYRSPRKHSAQEATR
jgi:hypothetical protein